MPRCIRCGCPNEQSHPDPYGLALCDTHNTQFQNGTIGQDYNPRRKQHPATEALAILNTISQPTESLRVVAARTGLSKDAIHQIRHQKWANVRSNVWEALLEAQADYIYTHNQQPTQLTLFEVTTWQTPTQATAKKTGSQYRITKDGMKPATRAEFVASIA